jgi:protein-S-isoprenylcysteine O-methyltransferase Ste14
MGYHLLHHVGKPSGTFENTSTLVKEGIYRYIRHPLYGSLVLLGLGAFLKNVTLITAALVLVNTAALVMTARVEEGEMIRRFGDDYTQYMKETKMFIPYLL